MAGWSNRDSRVTSCHVIGRPNPKVLDKFTSLQVLQELETLTKVIGFQKFVEP